MTNLEKYNNAFVEVLEVTPDQLGSALVYQSVPGWDSVGHMSLMAELEDQFDIMMETDDIIDFGGYDKGKEILAKYEIAVE